LNKWGATKLIVSRYLNSIERSIFGRFQFCIT
jgi:hypothetical protein